MEGNVSTAAEADHQRGLTSQLSDLEQLLVSSPQLLRKNLMGFLEQARANKDITNEAYTLLLLGGSAFYQGNYDDCQLFGEYSLRLTRKAQLRSLETRALNLIGLAAQRAGKYDECLDIFLRSLRLANELGDAVGQARALISIGSTYSDLRDHERALKFYQRGLGLIENTEVYNYEAYALKGICEELYFLDRPEEAAHWLPKAMQLTEQMDFKNLLWTLYRLQSRLFLGERQLNKALYAAQTGLQVALEAGNHEGVAVMHSLVGECYLNLAEYGCAYAELCKSEQLAQSTGLHETASATKRLLAKVCEIQGDLKLALSYLKSHLEDEAATHDIGVRRWAQTLSGRIRAEVLRRELDLAEQGKMELAATHAILRETEEELSYRSTHDLMTGAYNRTALWKEAQTVLSTLPPDKYAGILCADLDGLRAVNEQFGTVAGDALLLEVARRISANLSGSERLGRLGGDEFMILLPELNQPTALDCRAHQIIQSLREPFKFEGKSIHFSISFGCAAAPTDGQDIDTLFANAELALQQAKEQGPNTAVHFLPEMSLQERMRRRLEHDLLQSLQAEEFELYYQPQFTLPERRLTGFESLIRWTHPELGPVAPSQFIAVAERSGLIMPLGRWILQTACQQAKAWDFAQRGLTMAVNVSCLQFAKPDFVPMIAELLEKNGLPGECLTLEITESMVHSDLDWAIQTCQELRTLGVKIAMDDFGTGYSSLNVLKRMPFDLLKIDREFLAGTGLQPESLAIAGHFLTLIITLAHAINLKVIAEGVETKEQFQFLNDLGCDEAQGYWLSRPCPAAEAARCLEKLT